jgi:Lar family restriction alleviation protein
MPETSKLLPCPFCGSDDLLPSFHRSGDERLVCIACDGCEAEGPCTIVRTVDGVNDISRARAKWNARSALAASQDETS